MRPTTTRRDRGSVFLAVVALALLFGAGLLLALARSQAAWSDTGERLGASRALLRATAQLETARAILVQATALPGRGRAMLEVSIESGRIPGTTVEIERVGGVDGWYALTSRAESVGTTRIVRELFATTRPLSAVGHAVFGGPLDLVGGSEAPVSAAGPLTVRGPHSRFADDVWIGSEIDCASGALAATTADASPPHANSRELQLDESPEVQLERLRSRAGEGHLFPVDVEVELRFFVEDGEQRVEIGEWSRPTIELPEGGVRVAGGTIRTSRIEIPRFEEGVEWRPRPVFRESIARRRVPDHARVPFAAQRSDRVWSSRANEWRVVEVEEDWSELVRVGAVEESYLHQEFERYERVAVVVRRPGASRVVERSRWTEHAEPEPRPSEFSIRHPARRLRTRTLTLENGTVLFAEGRVRGIRGDVIGRITVASDNSIWMTGSIRYLDAEGDTATVGGGTVTEPFSRSLDYDGEAVLGLVARRDLVYSRMLPDHAEICANLCALTGSARLEGLTLGEEDEVERLNDFHDAWGRPVDGAFAKISLRRYGSLASARRPVEAVIAHGLVVSGFSTGVTLIDRRAAHAPPPAFPRLAGVEFRARQVIR